MKVFFTKSLVVLETYAENCTFKVVKCYMFQSNWKLCLRQNWVYSFNLATIFHAPTPTKFIQFPFPAFENQVAES